MPGDKTENLFLTTATTAIMLPLSLLLLLCAVPAGSIVCYKCDALKQMRSDCPGTYRRPVDTYRDLGDRGGLYTHCMEIRLRNGTVLHQDAYPGHPLCEHDFRLMWRQTLEKRYRQRISLTCCESDLCNAGAAVGGRSAWNTAAIVAVASVAALSSLLLLSMLLQCGGHPGGGGGANTTAQIVETTPVEANRRWRRNSWRLKEHQGQLFHIEGDTAMNGHDFEGRGAG